MPPFPQYVHITEYNKTTFGHYSEAPSLSYFFLPFFLPLVAAHTHVFICSTGRRAGLGRKSTGGFHVTQGSDSYAAPFPLAVSSFVFPDTHDGGRWPSAKLPPPHHRDLLLVFLTYASVRRLWWNEGTILELFAKICAWTKLERGVEGVDVECVSYGADLHKVNSLFSCAAGILPSLARGRGRRRRRKGEEWVFIITTSSEVTWHSLHYFLQYLQENFKDSLSQLFI